MTFRRLIPTLLVLAATAAPAAVATAEDNHASAVNTTDGAEVFQLSFDLQRISEGPVTQQNVAQAWASCEDCRTIAIAVQILLLMDDIEYVVPVNLSESLNYGCTGCETLAYAGQLVLSTGGKVRLTGQARRRIAAIKRAFAELQGSGASLVEIYAEITRLVADLQQTVVAGLVPIGRPRDLPAPQNGGTAAPVVDGEAAAPDGSSADAVSSDSENPYIESGDATDASEPAGDPADGALADTTVESPATEPSEPAPQPDPATSTPTESPEAPASTESGTVAEPEPTTTTTTTTSEPAPTTTTTDTTADEPAEPTDTVTTTEP